VPVKRVSVDTNFNWLGPDRPAISSSEASELVLAPGDRVVAYQDDDAWDATVRYDPNLPSQYRWYFELD
jgi:hypothetical protein